MSEQDSLRPVVPTWLETQLQDMGYDFRDAASVKAVVETPPMLVSPPVEISSNIVRGSKGTAKKPTRAIPIRAHLPSEFPAVIQAAADSVPNVPYTESNWYQGALSARLPLQYRNTTGIFETANANRKNPNAALLMASAVCKACTVINFCTAAALRDGSVVFMAGMTPAEIQSERNRSTQRRVR